jgi:HEAT repeat protein
MSWRSGKSGRGTASSSLLLWAATVTALASAYAASPASQEATRILRSQHTNDEDIQGRAVQRLVGFGPNAVQPLIVALRSKNPYARVTAARVFGELRDTTATLALIGALTDLDAEVRRRSVEALGEIGDPRALAPLRASLTKERPSENNYLLIALGKLSDTLAIAQLAAKARKGGFWDPKDAVFALSSVGRPLATESLGALLQVDNPGRRFVAIQALGICRDTTARHFLRQAIGDSVAQNRDKALADLVAMDTANAPGILRPLLSSGFADLRATAASRILPSDTRTLTPDLLLVYHHPDSAVRVAAVDCVARVCRATQDSSERRSALSMVIRAVHDSSALVRRRASRALFGCGDYTVDSVRISALGDPDDEVRMFALWGLQRHSPEKVPLEPFLPLLNGRYSSSRFEAIKVLAYRGDGRAARALLALLPEAPEAIRAAVAWSFTELKDTLALPDLIPLLEDYSARVRWWAAAALGDIGDARATSYLVDALTDTNTTVALTAAGALGLLRDAAAIPGLVRIAQEACPELPGTTPEAKLAQRRNAMSARSTRALATLGGPGTGALLLLLRDSASSIRKQAAIVLTGIQDSSASRALDDAMRRKDLTVVASVYQYYLKQNRTADETTIAAALVKFGDWRMADACGKSESRTLKSAAARWRRQKHPRPRLYYGGHDTIAPNPWDEEAPPSWRY